MYLICKGSRYLKLSVLAAVLGAAVSFSTVSVGGAIPVIDFLQIQTLIAQSVQQINQMLSIVNGLNLQYLLTGKSDDAKIQTMVNDTVNIITRLSQNNNDRYNKQLKMDAKPAFDACQTYSIANALNKGTCFFINGVQTKVKTEVEKALGGDLTKSNAENEHQAVESVLDFQKELVQKTGEQTAGISGSTFLNPQLGGYQDQSSEDKATLFRELVLDPIPAKHIDPRLSAAKPYVAKQDTVKNEIYAARKSVAATSLAYYQQVYTKDQYGVSQMGMYEKFVKGRIDSPKWIKEITNTDPDKSSDPNAMTTPAQVMRSTAEDVAFQSYLSVKIYQSLLRQEVELATLISMSNKQAVVQNS